jgi:hypothetical protein
MDVKDLGGAAGLSMLRRSLGVGAAREPLRKDMVKKFPCIAPVGGCAVQSSYWAAVPEVWRPTKDPNGVRIFLRPRAVAVGSRRRCSAAGPVGCCYGG